jgi:beta-lactamase class D
MRDSVVWYFQRVAEKLGMARERDYLKKFDYSSGSSAGSIRTSCPPASPRTES